MRPLPQLAFACAAVVATSLLGTAAPVARATALRHPHVDALDHVKQWDAAGSRFGPAGVDAGAWCGPYGSADDTAHEVAQSGPKFHLVIAYPSDVAADLQRLGDTAFATVKVLEAFWTQRVGVGRVGDTALGWKVRFDYGTAGCAGRTDGSLYPDISFYRLPHPASYYPGGTGTTPYSQVANDLTASGLYGASNKRYLVHFVGSGGDACGQSYIYSPTDSAGGNRYSIIYYFDSDGVSQCTWETDAHELGHSLGAATGGPQNNDGAHTWDCYNDVMSYANAALVASHCGDQVLYFDYGHDNYFAHGGAWNDTRLSAYWCKPTC